MPRHRIRQYLQPNPELVRAVEMGVAGPDLAVEVGADGQKRLFNIELKTKVINRADAVEWAAQAEAYLPAEKANLVKSWVADALKADIQEIRAEQQKLEDALEKLLSTDKPTVLHQHMAHWIELSSLSPMMSVAKLLKELVAREPGKTSTHYIQLVRQVKGLTTKAEDVHSGLYKLAKAGELFKGEGKPVRYYLHPPAAEGPQV